MPEMDGFEVCQKIRQMASYAETPDHDAHREKRGRG